MRKNNAVRAVYPAVNDPKKISNAENYLPKGVAEYYLMHRNIRVARFKMSRNGINLQIIEIINSDHMPIGTRGYTGPILNLRFMRWKDERCIPKSRKNVEKIAATTGLTIKEIETINMGVSLTDCYWFCPVDENYSWEDVNYYKNSFSEDFGKLLLGEDITDEPINVKTPDITTCGMLPKKWVIQNGGLYLYKTGLSETNQEVCNEVFCSALAELLGMPFVPYYMMDVKDRKYSCCPSFIAASGYDPTVVEFVSMQQISTDKTDYGEGRPAVIKFMNANGMAEFRSKMIVFDFLVGNQDRHFGNFGFLRNAETLEIIGPAPLFDFDRSMGIGFPDKKDNDIAKPFANTHREQLSLVKNFDWWDDSLIGKLRDNVDTFIDAVYSLGGLKNEVPALQEYMNAKIKALENYIVSVRSNSLQQENDISITPKVPAPQPSRQNTGRREDGFNKYKERERGENRLAYSKGQEPAEKAGQIKMPERFKKQDGEERHEKKYKASFAQPTAEHSEVREELNDIDEMDMDDFVEGSTG